MKKRMSVGIKAASQAGSDLANFAAQYTPNIPRALTGGQSTFASQGKKQADNEGDIESDTRKGSMTRFFHLRTEKQEGGAVDSSQSQDEGGHEAAGRAKSG